MTGAGTGDPLPLHLTRVGHGPPLVLLHGFTGSAATWAPLATALGDRFSTYAVDLPGHGGSPASPDPARGALPRVADDLAATLDAHGLGAVALLGYSMGGRAALHFAVRHPARVRALVLEGTSPGIDDEGERAARVAADEALARAIEGEGIEAFVDRWERLPLWASQASLPAEVRDALRAQRRRNDPAGLAASLRGAGAGASPSLAPALGALTMPVLLVAGALDPKYVGEARRMAALMPHARVEVVAGAGHAVHLERPEAFFRVVAEFLTGVP